MAKRIRMVLPAGRAAWVHLDIPDDKFGEPKYKLSVSYTAEELKPIKAKILEAAKDLMGSKFNPKKLPKLPIRASKDKEGNEDGAWLIGTQSGKDYKPALFDAKLNKLLKAPGPGSLVKVDVAPAYYEAFGGGISLRLYGVQVIEMAQGGSTMFEAEDGYEAAPAKDSSPFEAEASDEDDAVSF